MATPKEELLQEIEQAPESTLEKVLEFIRSLKAQPQQGLKAEAWQAYLASEQEREGVYRRLADS